MNPPIVTADLYDVHHERVAVCEAQFCSFGKRLSFFGPCVTLKVFEDHAPVLETLRMKGEGRVLVVDAGGSLRVGVMGDRVAAVGVTNGWMGAVIYGAIRDSAGINDLDFGVKALGATARRTWIHGAHHRDIPLQFGGTHFVSGHWIYADADSVLVSPTQLDLALVPAPPF